MLGKNLVILIGTLIALGGAPPSEASRHSKKGRPLRSTSIVSGQVVRVADGDTLSVLESLPDGSKQTVKIRLDGIDAPEKSQPFGEFCRKKLADQVAGKSVQVRVRKLDRYGRSLGTLLISSGEEGDPALTVNLNQVKEGCAWFYRSFAHEQASEDRAAFERAEKLAREQKKGLWRDGDPIPPWEFRKSNRGRPKTRKRSS